MPRPIKSIRWRFALWLGFLLTAVLAGFGTTAYQLHRNNQFEQLDEDLKSRAAALSAVLRTPPMQSNRGPRGFGPRDRMGSPNDREPQRRNGSANRSGSRTNSPSRADRPFDDGPPLRFSPDDEPPGRPWELGNISDHFTQKIKQSAAVARLFDESATNSFYYAVWLRAFGTAHDLQSSNAPGNVLLPEHFGSDTSTHARTRDHFREVWHYTEMGDCVLVGKSVGTELEATRHFALWLVLGGLAVLSLGVVGIWMIAGQVLKPVHAISAAATRISAGNLTERINVSATDNELGELAQTLNSTFARLEAAFAQQKQFTADASHELRTPLAVLISEAQTTLARPRNEAEYRETIETCLATAQQMRKLTEALLELARYDSDQEKVPRTRVDLAAVATDVVKLVRPLAAQRQLEIITDFSPAPTLGNADRLAQVVTNLLSNAIEYSKSQGQIRITTRAHEKEVLLIMQDQGEGIPPDDLPHIFKRFHRADKSRSRAQGHSGLGLSICQSIVEAHGGEITVASQLGEGTTFTLCLPASA
jgi:two-component system OmpR family sensor kinase